MTKIITKIKDLISRFVNVMSNLLEAMARDSNLRGDDFGLDTENHTFTIL